MYGTDMYNYTETGTDLETNVAKLRKFLSENETISFSSLSYEVGDTCKKCGSKNILTRYIAEGKSVELEDFVPETKEWDKYYNFGKTYRAPKECLKKHCRNCGYEWIEDVNEKG